MPLTQTTHLLCVVALLLGLVGRSDAVASSDCKSYTGSYANKPGTWNLSWTIDCDAQLFTGVVTAEAQGWVGFGLNTEPKMRGANVIQAHVNATSFEFVNARAIGHSEPVPVILSVYNVTGVLNGTRSVFSFSRHLGVQDADNRTVADNSYIIWAYNQDNPSFGAYHTDRGAEKLNLFTGNASTTVNYALIHALLMVFAWGFLAPIGTFAARYLKHIGHNWYRLHSSIQYSVLAFVVASFIIIENYIGSGYKNHFLSKHAIIGTVIVGLAILQVILGILSNALFKPERTKIPHFPDQLHWWLGRSVMILSLVNIFLGFDLYGLKKSNISPFIIYGVWIGITLLTILFMEIKQGQVNHAAPEYVPLNGAKEQHSKTPVITYIIYSLAGVVLFSACFYELYIS